MVAAVSLVSLALLCPSAPLLRPAVRPSWRSQSEHIAMTIAHEPPEKLVGLMLQCAVQAQLSYFNQFKNELRAKWLQAFLGHEHLGVERTSGRTDGGRILYHGLSDGLRCSWHDYLTTMLRGLPEEYKCRYKVGTPDTAGGPGAGAQSAASMGAHTGVAPPWAAASASRASNPYLKKAATYREFTELIEPRRVAQGLISIMRQLALEWQHDFELIALEGDYLREAYGTLRGEECDVDAVLNTVLDGTNVSKAMNDGRIKLPPAVYTSLRAATAAWSSDLAEAYAACTCRIRLLLTHPSCSLPAYHTSTARGHLGGTPRLFLPHAVCRRHPRADRVPSAQRTSTCCSARPRERRRSKHWLRSRRTTRAPRARAGFESAWRSRGYRPSRRLNVLRCHTRRVACAWHLP